MTLCLHCKRVLHTSEDAICDRCLGKELARSIGMALGALAFIAMVLLGQHIWLVRHPKSEAAKWAQVQP